jgi:L-cysteine S-thiosulfotransferase
MRFKVLFLLALMSAPAAAQQPVPLHTEGQAAPSPWARYRGWTTTKWPTYSTLAERDRTPKTLGKPLEIATPITGDAKKGKDLAFSRAKGGGCLTCHVMGPDSQETPGNAGPDLSEIGDAGRPDEYLFNYIWDPRHLNADSAMPPWGAHGFYTREEIIDVVAFLKTLKKPATFRNALDDPNKRPLPVEDRDALDPFVNPGADRIDSGAALFARTAPSGKSCASCHADPKAAFKGWATARMPKWEPRLNKMQGVEEFVFRHAKATIGTDYLMQGRENTDLAVYLYSLSNGQPVTVDLGTPEAKRVYEFGKLLYDTKIGQFNFSCTDCHSVDKGGNKWLRGQYVGDGKGQLDHFPLWRTSRNEIWDIRKRLQWCNVQVRANELPPDAVEYDALELYLRTLSQGMPLTAPNIRH